MDIFYNLSVIIFFSVILIFLVVQFYNIVFRGYAPFIPSHAYAMEEAARSLDLKEDGVLYELGCGSAGFLRLVRDKYPKAKLIGIEYFILPYVIAQIQNALSDSRIKILKKNFFNVNLSDADAIYCFLSIEQMAMLKPKLEKECKPGTTLISYHFTLPGKAPEKIIEMEKKNKLYLYKL